MSRHHDFNNTVNLIGIVISVLQNKNKNNNTAQQQVQIISIDLGSNANNQKKNSKLIGTDLL